MSKSPSLRRIQADIRELALDPSDRYHAAPLENDMFEWHFTIRGAEGTEFEGGIYHGRILLPPEYPFKPPHIIFLTPSGRFETNTKVCLSFSAFHPELWQPAWGIRLILEALISFLPTPADGAIGALDWTKEERQRLAKLSQSFCCSQCGKCQDLLPQLKDTNGDNSNSTNTAGSSTKSRFAKEIEELQRLQQLAERKVKTDETVGPTASLEQTREHEQQQQQQQQQQPGPSSEVEEAKPPARELNSSLLVTERITATNNQVENLQLDQSTKAPDQDSEAVMTTNPPNPAPTTTTTGNANVVEENHIPDLEQPLVDHSWIYDPLLNVMIVVLAAICYLLLQKYQDLMVELNDLRHLSEMGKK